MTKQENKWLYLFIGLAAMANLSGLFVPVIDPDAGVYASLAKHMVQTNNYVDLIFSGEDWLDKPHFPFWISAFSFKLFGIYTWSYKLPGIAFVFLGAYYTYLFAKRFYNKTIALWSVFILLTAEHIIISNNDIRAEPFLTGLIIAAVYHFSQSLKAKISWHLVFATLFTACAIMTKGIFTLIPIAGAVAGELIIKKEWKQFLHWRWFFCGLLIVIFITPELYCLWQQFDKHPEKIVFGKTGVSGIRFFLWDSQFGRFTNTGPIKGESNYFYFFYMLIWAFFPWPLFMYASWINKIRSGIKKIDLKKEEWFTISGSLLLLFVFSLSKFQLPYYCNIVFPFFSILAAALIFKSEKSLFVIFRITLVVALILVLGGSVFLQVFFKPEVQWYQYLLLLIITGVLIIISLLHRWLKTDAIRISLYRIGLISIVANLYLNWIFYPSLMKYQAGNEAAFYMNKNYPGTPVVLMNDSSPAFEFYLKSSIIKPDTASMKSFASAIKKISFVSEDELAFFNKQKIPYEILKEFKNYHVSKITAQFFIKKTRDKALSVFFLVRML